MWSASFLLLLLPILVSAQPSTASSSSATVVTLPLTYIQPSTAPSSSTISLSLLPPLEHLLAILTQWVPLHPHQSTPAAKSVTPVLKKVKGLLESLLSRGEEAETKDVSERGLLGGIVGVLDVVLDVGWGSDVVKGRGGIANDWYGTLSFGSPPQEVKLTFDTGSSDLWLISSACSSCSLSNHTAFSPSLSSPESYKNLTTPWSITYADDSTISGYLSTDTVSLPSETSLSSFPFALANELSQPLYTYYTPSGLVGFAQSGLASIEMRGERTTLMESLVREGMLKENMVSIRMDKRGAKPSGGLLGRGISEVGNYGEFVIGGVEERWIRGGREALDWVPVASSLYWGIEMSDVRMVGRSVLDPSTKRRAIIDSGTNIIITSTALAASVHSRIPFSSFDPDSGIWTVPCSIHFPAAPNIFFVLGEGVLMGLPVEELAWRDDGTGKGRCISGIQGGLDSFSVLGEIFIRNHYVVLSYGSNGDDLSIGFGDRTDVHIIL